MKLSFKTLAIVMVTGIVLLAGAANASVSPYSKFDRRDTSESTQKDNKKRDKENIQKNEQAEITAFRVLLMPLKNAEAVRMFVEKEKGKRLSVRLKSPDGYPLIHFLTDKKPSSVYRKFNFLEAPEGVYTFEISDGKQTLVKKIILERTRSEVKSKLAVE